MHTGNNGKEWWLLLDPGAGSDVVDSEDEAVGGGPGASLPPVGSDFELSLRPTTLTSGTFRTHPAGRSGQLRLRPRRAR